MKSSFTRLVLTFFTISLLFACSSKSLTYKLDPEIKYLDNFNSKIKIVSVKVIDSRSSSETAGDGSVLVSGPSKENEILQKKLITILKENDLKIISKPLLADLGIEIELKQLQVSTKKETFKSIISAKSELILTVNKKSQRWSKVFKASRTQEVANPVNELDVTGVMNQMLSKQFSNAFSDTKLKEFIDGDQF